QRLAGLGLATPNTIKRLWDVDPSFGGPIKKDKLWFFTSMRILGAYNYKGSLFYNANANNPSAWRYVADTIRPAVDQQIYDDAQGRLTWQANARNKFGIVYNHSDTNVNAPFGNPWMWVLTYRAAVSYVTGTHAFKVGFNNGTGHNDIGILLHQPYSYRFNNGVPNQLTLRTDSLIHSRYNYDFGLYAQDKWT